MSDLNGRAWLLSGGVLFRSRPAQLSSSCTSQFLGLGVHARVPKRRRAPSWDGLGQAL